MESLAGVAQIQPRTNRKRQVASSSITAAQMSIPGMASASPRCLNDVRHNPATPSQDSAQRSDIIPSRATSESLSITRPTSPSQLLRCILQKTYFDIACLNLTSPAMCDSVSSRSPLSVSPGQHGNDGGWVVGICKIQLMKELTAA